MYHRNLADLVSYRLTHLWGNIASTVQAFIISGSFSRLKILSFWYRLSNPFSDRLDSHASQGSFKPNSDELRSSDHKVMQAFPHLTPWKVTETVSNASVRIRTCSHPLCAANLIMDIVVTSQIPKKAQDMDDKDTGYNESS